MRHILAALSLIAFTSASAFPAAPEPAVASRETQAAVPAAPIRILPADQARADIAIMRSALETIHPGLYRRTSKPEIDHAFDTLDAEIGGTISDAELYGKISLLLAKIRCTHTKADQTEAMEEWRRDYPSHLPFRFRIIDGRMLIVSSDPAQRLIPRGPEILSVNGEPVSALISKLGAYVPIEGFTEPSRAQYLADDSDLMGAGLDHFYPYAFGFLGSFSLVLRDSDAAPVRAMELAPISFRTWTGLPDDGGAYRSDFADATTWKILHDNVGYIRIDTFVNYRQPANAAALYARALSELRSAGARRLIVDLRHNGGGSNDAALALIDALATTSYTFQRAMRYRAIRYGDLPKYISSWGNRDELFHPDSGRFSATPDGWFDLRAHFAPEELQVRTPAPGAFEGPVAVLTGPANASGATMVVAKLRDLGRIRIVGERSGGSADGATAGKLFSVKLPNSGISVRVPLVFNQMDVTDFDPQGGINPDIHVPETVADFREGRDRTLEEAIADLARAPMLSPGAP